MSLPLSHGRRLLVRLAGYNHDIDAYAFPGSFGNASVTQRRRQLMLKIIALIDQIRYKKVLGRVDA